MINTNGLVVCSTSVSQHSRNILCLFVSKEYGIDLNNPGYLAWEYPTNRLLQRLPLGKYSAVCIIVWGLILSCFAAAKNYPGAIAIRFFLGVFEAAVTPGFALLTSQVYHPPPNSH
jgi:MFS family permease